MAAHQLHLGPACFTKIIQMTKKANMNENISKTIQFLVSKILRKISKGGGGGPGKSYEPLQWGEGGSKILKKPLRNY